MMTDEEKRMHFKNACLNYVGVSNEEFELVLKEADKGLGFPEEPSDVLEYLGNLEPLQLSDKAREELRRWTQNLLERREPAHVWNGRIALKLELHYLQETFGWQMP